LPRPGSDYSHRLDQGGRARSINQDQWSIGYLDYFARQENLQLPRRVKLVSDNVTLKLIIERWQQATIDASPSDLFPTFN
jgi:outer membrane lipoprotein LolB